MNHLSFCRWIGLPQPALDCVAALSVPDYPELRALFERDVKAFQQEVLKYPDWRQRFLWLYTRLGSEAVDRLMAQGVSEQILRDTFYDQVIWYENCVRKYGEPGLAQYDWLWWPIKGLMFRLGRLQFHPVALEEELRLPTITLPKGAIVLNTHIPQGEPLDFDAAQASFAQAIRFFRGANPVFVCHSWLLEPALKQLLKEDSRIVRFQQLFTLIHLDENDRQAEGRIFRDLQDDPSLYPQNTSLQRAARQYLMQGGKLGAGFGAYHLQSEEDPA